MELNVLDKSGQPVDALQVADEILKGEVSNGILHQVVRWHRNRQRAGTHAVKTRAQVAGGGRKPYRQKGTGNARAGSNTSPLWVGGGVAHGPQVRSYAFALNKSERRLALKHALRARQQEGRLLLLESFSLDEVKTKYAASTLRSLGIPQGASVTIVVPDIRDEVLTKSLRNIPGVRIRGAASLSVMDVVSSKYLLLLREAMQQIEARISTVTKRGEKSHDEAAADAE